MRIGVTGGTGFIGQHFIKEYSAEHEFVVISSGKGDKVLETGNHITYITSDYSQESMEEAFKGCDCIVHLGAKRSSKESELAFENYEENISFSNRLFRAASNIGITNIVNISSTAVYDRNLSCPFREETAVSPLSLYGVCKRTIEMCADLYYKRNKLNIKSLRVAQVIGAGERAGYMLSIFQERCRNNEPLMVYGHGQAGKEYIYIKDLTNAIMCACEKPDVHGVFNIGSGIYTTNLELAKCFCEVFDNKASYQLLTDKKEDVYDYFMNVEKAEKDLDFKAKYNLYEAITDLKKETSAK